MNADSSFSMKVMEYGVEVESIEKSPSLIISITKRI